METTFLVRIVEVLPFCEGSARPSLFHGAELLPSGGSFTGATNGRVGNGPDLRP